MQQVPISWVKAKHDGGVSDSLALDVSAQTCKKDHFSLCVINTVSTLLNTTNCPAADSIYNPNSQQLQNFDQQTEMAFFLCQCGHSLPPSGQTGEDTAFAVMLI